MDRLDAHDYSGENGTGGVSAARFREVYERLFSRPYCVNSGPAWGATKRALSLAYLKEFCKERKDALFDFEVSSFF